MVPNEGERAQKNYKAENCFSLIIVWSRDSHSTNEKLVSCDRGWGHDASQLLNIGCHCTTYTSSLYPTLYPHAHILASLNLLGGWQLPSS